MRKIFIASIFVFAFCVCAFGQVSNCPTISVTGPSSATQLGETATFTANVSRIEMSKIEYQWSIDKGTIVEGQGTSTVTVSTEGLEDSTVTALVEIKGFPEGCPNSDAETTIPFDPPWSVLIDELEISSKPINMERLNAWIAELKGNPDSTMYFVTYTNEKFSSEKIRQNENRIKKQFTDEKIATDRLVFVNSKNSDNDEKNIIRVWRIPLGAEPPTP